jgi:hypothetical protein
MSRAGNGEKLYYNLRSGCVLSVIILMVCFAGCASAPQGTTPLIIPATTFPPYVSDTVPTITEPLDTLSPPTPDQTTVPDPTPIINPTPNTTMNSSPSLIPDVITVPSSLQKIVPSNVIIGRWSFTDEEGIPVTLTFLAGGQFSGTIGGEPSPQGTWKSVQGNEYTVTFPSGESWDFVYDADADTLYDVTNPAISINRQ